MAVMRKAVISKQRKSWNREEKGRGERVGEERGNKEGVPTHAQIQNLLRETVWNEAVFVKLRLGFAVCMVAAISKMVSLVSPSWAFGLLGAQERIPDWRILFEWILTGLYMHKRIMGSAGPISEATQEVKKPGRIKIRITPSSYCWVAEDPTSSRAFLILLGVCRGRSCHWNPTSWLRAGRGVGTLRGSDLTTGSQQICPSMMQAGLWGRRACFSKSGTSMNSLVQVACLWAPQCWRVGEGQHKLESLPRENGSSFSFSPTELVLSVPQVPTLRLPLPAFGVTGLICAFLVHGLSCRALPGALLRQLVFPH